ncbi:cerebellin-2-like isoform X2 [Triplophysa dalaica]|uniref:cerebellin-2-like isoform X2 n=1 Tax=Triplophysa dalaica TaxID=1582913 RepID=UPI0024E01E53|nr:cerebellin-2-like isoform X2 [Triplophysa dalaica]
MMQALRSFTQALEIKFESLQAKNTALRSSTQASEIKLQSLQAENTALRSSTQASEIKVQSLQAENTARKVAFSAGLLNSGPKNTGPFEESRTLVYQKIFSNIGNAYDSNTGIFTAPVKGVYFFRFSGHSHSIKKMAVSLYKNNEKECSVYDKTESTPIGNGSNGVVLTLEKADKVHTELWKDSWVYDDEQTFTSFSGFMLFPL